MSAPLGAHLGTVERFDDSRGIGTVRSVDGHGYPFHCTAITDGTRTIATGVAVTFRVAAGRRGRWEATAVTPAPAG